MYGGKEGGGCPWTAKVSLLRVLLLRTTSTVTELPKAALDLYNWELTGWASDHVTTVTTKHTGYMIQKFILPPTLKTHLKGHWGWQEAVNNNEIKND